nr:unnamed protein product [Callosobruchus chinensis]
MDFEDITEEEKSIIAEYFTKDQWNEVSEWEKNDIFITLKRYLTFKDCKGINIPPPDFMVKRTRLTDNSDSKKTSDKKEEVSVKDKSAEEKSLPLKHDYQNSSASKENVDYNQPVQKTSKKSNRKGSNTKPPKKYPKRSVPAKNYHEPEEPNDDRYTCGKLSFLQDNPVKMNTTDRAKKTCPKGVLIVRPSNIHGFGVFALKLLPKGVQMGPYEGQAVKQETKTGYAWKLRNGKLVNVNKYFFELYNSKVGVGISIISHGLMRFVCDILEKRIKRHFDANCQAFGNVDKKILILDNFSKFLTTTPTFFQTCKNIGPNEELLVYYGHSFAKSLGIDPKNFYEPNTSKVKNYYTCQHCHIGLSTQQFRDAHQLRCRFRPNRMITFDVNKAVICQYCSRCFEKAEDLEEHEKRCRHRKKTHVSKLHSTSSSKFCCKGCRKIFTAKRSLDVHILRMHPSLIDSVSSKVHVCHICEYKTTITTLLTKHMLTHSKENAQYFQCSTCQYKTYYKSDYNRHLTIHQETKPLGCTECGKGFAQKLHLDRHILNNHTDNVLLMKSITNKIHCCQHCDYKAINITHLKSHLKKHELIHLQTKPFGCTECGKGFALKQHLDSHILNNHTDNVLLIKSITHKIHSCQHCDYKGYIYITHLKRHLKKH